jgi:predicted nucleic acid-binding Zn ribbon protein
VAPQSRAGRCPMPKDLPRPEVTSEGARALVGAIRVASCPVCRAPLTGRQTVCSGKCRATLSRRRQEQRRQDRDARIATLLREAAQLVEEGQK